MADSEALNLEGEGHLDLIVSELPLTSGTYRLDSFLESNEPHDIVAHAAELSVVDGDFFGTGKFDLRPTGKMWACWSATIVGRGLPVVNIVALLRAE